MTTTPASEIYPDVLQLAQRIVREVNTLVTGVETLDANNWLSAADRIDSLNNQLQNLLIPTPPAPPETSSAKSTKS